MRTLCPAILLGALLTVSLAADTHEVIKTSIAGHQTVYGQYVQGKNTRTENLDEQPSRMPVVIQNSERRIVYELDLQSREYEESSFGSPDLILSLAQLIARPPRVRNSGKIVNIYHTTIDTGDRREFFGRTAKHLVLRARSVAEPGACDRSHENKNDGWYIPPNRPGTRNSAYRLVMTDAILTGSVMCRDTIVEHGDSSPPGIPVLETDGFMTREVLELSNEPLDSRLFEVPSGFKKVDALPGHQRPMSWSGRLEMEWSQLGRAFGSWFQ